MARNSPISHPQLQNPRVLGIKSHFLDIHGWQNRTCTLVRVFTILTCPT